MPPKRQIQVRSLVAGPSLIKENMYKVIGKNTVSEFESLDLALVYAKTLAEFVTIQGGEFEIVGKFGVDSIADGKCPDGVAYDWNKASRIGATRRR